jgi:hypothetical protein
METYIVDRIEEGTWVVLEDEEGRAFPIPRAWLPQRTREGDALRLTVEAGSGDDQVLHFTLDPGERERRETEIAALRNRLTRGPSGDISL